MSGHVVQIGLWSYKVLEHPDPDPECTVDAVMSSLRLEDGRYQVQGTYRELPAGAGYERLGP